MSDGGDSSSPKNFSTRFDVQFGFSSATSKLAPDYGVAGVGYSPIQWPAFGIMSIWTFDEMGSKDW